MVTIYTTPSSLACRKAKAWLKKNEISFNERNLYSQPLSIEEIKEILRKRKAGQMKSSQPVPKIQKPEYRYK